MRRQRFGYSKPRQRVAAVAVRQPQHGVQNPNGRPEQVIKAFRSPVLIKRMNQTHHRGSPRAQNRHFCAFLAFVTPVFGRFEHENGFFVSEWAIFPLFSGISSTKSGFLCSGREGIGIGKRNRCLPANHRARFKNANTS